MIAAETAVRAWVNAWAASAASNGALEAGAYLDPPRSPAAGAYALLSRQGSGPRAMVAEDPAAVSTARIQFDCYHATEDLAERAAAALATAIESLTGNPAPCGGTGVRILCHDALTGPVFAPPAPDTGEAFCFQIAADFVLADR